MKALIIGILGQDGSYLAKLLIQKGYEVWGTSRDLDPYKFNNLKQLGILNYVKLVKMLPTDFSSCYQCISKIEPDEIYNLSGQSSVARSFVKPLETMESINATVTNILENIRSVNKKIKLYNAGSSEVFGEIDKISATELTPFRPRSPYAVAKAGAAWQVSVYRESYDIFACTGILFNHESPLRPEYFVTRKIIRSVVRIASGSKEKLVLGNLDIRRDWGWASDYVEAMWLMMNQQDPQDFIIGTGKTYSLKQFVEYAFSLANLNWQDHVVIDKTLFRPLEIMNSMANPQKAKDILGWSSKKFMPDVIVLLLKQEGLDCNVNNLA